MTASRWHETPETGVFPTEFSHTYPFPPIPHLNRDSPFAGKQKARQLSNERCRASYPYRVIAERSGLFQHYGTFRTAARIAALGRFAPSIILQSLSCKPY